MTTAYWLFGSLAIFPLIVKWVGDLMEFIDEQHERRKNDSGQPGVHARV